MKPLISVIVPCYKQVQYLDECLQSVLDQKYQNWECIVVNDGSPDRTEEVAKKWVKKDGRFRYIYKENGGLSSARNVGVKEAKGEWILPLDADDRIGNQYMELAEREFIENPTIVYCEADFFGDKSERWELEDFSFHGLAITNIIFCSAFYRKDRWLEVNGYDENLVYGLEDWDFWIALLKKGGLVTKINKVCFYYRVKPESMIKNLDIKKRKFSIDYISNKHSEFFISQLGNFSELLSFKYKYEEIIQNKSYKIFNQYFVRLWNFKIKLKRIINRN